MSQIHSVLVCATAHMHMHMYVRTVYIYVHGTWLHLNIHVHMHIHTCGERATTFGACRDSGLNAKYSPVP